MIIQIYINNNNNKKTITYTDSRMSVTSVQLNPLSWPRPYFLPPSSLPPIIDARCPWCFLNLFIGKKLPKDSWVLKSPEYGTPSQSMVPNIFIKPNVAGWCVVLWMGFLRNYPSLPRKALIFGHPHSPERICERKASFWKMQNGLPGGPWSLVKRVRLERWKPPSTHRSFVWLYISIVCILHIYIYIYICMYMYMRIHMLSALECILFFTK